MSQLDVQSLVCAACSCKTFHRAAQADQLWRHLFHQRWGSESFSPPSTYDGSSGSGECGGSSRALGNKQFFLQEQSQQHWRTAAGPLTQRQQQLPHQDSKEHQPSSSTGTDIKPRDDAGSVAARAATAAAACAHNEGQKAACDMQAAVECIHLVSRSNGCTISCKSSSSDSQGRQQLPVDLC